MNQKKGRRECRQELEEECQPATRERSELDSRFNPKDLLRLSNLLSTVLFFPFIFLALRGVIFYLACLFVLAVCCLKSFFPSFLSNFLLLCISFFFDFGLPQCYSPRSMLFAVEKCKSIFGYSSLSSCNCILCERKIISVRSML